MVATSAECGRDRRRLARASVLFENTGVRRSVILDDTIANPLERVCIGGLLSISLGGPIPQVAGRDASKTCKELPLVGSEAKGVGRIKRRDHAIGRALARRIVDLQSTVAGSVIDNALRDSAFGGTIVQLVQNQAQFLKYAALTLIRHRYEIGFHEDLPWLS